MTPRLSQWPTVAHTLYRTFGARGLILRAEHETRRRLGWFRAHPNVLHPDAGGAPLFEVASERFRNAEWSAAALARAERVLGGEHQAFRDRWMPLPSAPSDWARHPTTGKSFPDVPWWQVPMLSPELGDIKSVWEAGRFAWGYDLIRGFLITADERYVEAFFERLAAWCESSPPFRGPHWACGQETAIRAVMLVYAAGAFGKAQSTTPARRALLSDVLGWSGERIREGIGYAISQRNNHAISEAAGLVVIGLELDGRHPDAAAWHRFGTELLGRLIEEQVAADGWYIQHSFNYLRLALDQCVVAQRALLSRARSLPEAAVDRLKAAGQFLSVVIDPMSGEVPNHGANDGALVHPTSSGGSRDFRPVCTALAATFGFGLPGGVEPDLETLAWLGATAAPPPPGGDHLATGPSGWAGARIGPFQMFFRAGRYRARPGHLDPLHFDLRVNGAELLVDPGTYSYNAPDPWRNGLATAAVHNGPIVNDLEPGLRGPRFLWYLWPEADLTIARLDGGRLTLVGEIPGRVRRTIEATAEEVKVTDTALAPDSRRLTVAWLLHPEADPQLIEVEGAARWVAAAEGSVVGWFSPGYGRRLPSRSLIGRRDGGPGVSLVTRIRVPTVHPGKKDLSDPETDDDDRN